MKIICFLSIFLFPKLVYSQSYAEDAIRFSNTQPFGSARIQALGGASVALGADPSTIASNPAGLGLYNKSELVVTTAFNKKMQKSTFNGNISNTAKFRLSLDQVSISIFSPSEAYEEDWLGGSWSLGVQKINDFNTRSTYTGINTKNSLINFFIENSNGQPVSDFPSIDDAFDFTSLAYYTYLISPWDIHDSMLRDDEYFSDITSFLKPTLEQSETHQTHGAQYQTTIGYGGNFSDVFYLGINLGLTSLKYESEKKYIEKDYYYLDDDKYHPINNFIAQEKLIVDGNGVNLTMGIIIRPIPNFRVGFSILTPTLYSINDVYETKMEVNWNNFYHQNIIDGDTILNSIFLESSLIQSAYSLKTPTKYALGTAFFLNKKGFITVDLEFVNYKKVELESQDFLMNSENDYLKNNFQQQINIRTGIEVRLAILKLRGGFYLNSTPVNKKNTFQSNSMTFSVGAGLLFNNFYTDLALVYIKQKSKYSPYLLSDYSEPIITNDHTNVRATLSLGFRF